MNKQILIISDIETVLNKIRQNCNVLANYHRKRYLVIKSRLIRYKIPILIFSALNSVSAVSLQPYMQQQYISLINMSLSLIIGLISSLEMLYGLSKALETELTSSKDFNILSYDIYRWLSLNIENRIGTPKEFLGEIYTRYIKLIETSIILKKKIDDKLVNINYIETKDIETDSDSSLTNSNDSLNNII